MSELREKIKTFDLNQLTSLREFVDGLISSKHNETKRTVWRVVAYGTCHENFREDEYLKAAAYLLEKAKEIDADARSDRIDRQIELIGHRVPESEYEGWFNG